MREFVSLICEDCNKRNLKVAFDYLTKILKEKQIDFDIDDACSFSNNWNFLIRTIDDISNEEKRRLNLSIPLLKSKGAVWVKKVNSDFGKTFVISGSDSLGVMYALFDFAQTLESSKDLHELWEEIDDISEEPFIKHRSIQMQMCNYEVESKWYYDKKYWEWCFQTLAMSRMNSFTMTFGHQTSYMVPPYPFFIKLPEYPDVRVSGLSDEKRERNLEMLKYITNIASDYGVEFNFSVWMQTNHLPFKWNLGTSDVEGIPDNPVEYNAAALEKLLKECPGITGVQFRMNNESGINEDQQSEFYTKQFRAIKNIKRPIFLDLRLKGLRDETLEVARALGLNYAISSKYWSEFLGQPYPLPIVDVNYRSNHSYGFGQTVRNKRDYSIIYQLWTSGSQRLLVWGDPSYASNFSRSVNMYRGDAFEIFMPLTNKGFGTKGKDWSIYKEGIARDYQFEHEKYWFFYQCFGRMGYNPNTDEKIFLREFKKRFGLQYRLIFKLYCIASKILPLIGSAHFPSEAMWNYWYEMEPGFPIEAYSKVPPADTNQMYGIRTAMKTPELVGFFPETKRYNFNRIKWDQTIPGYVEDAINGTLSGKTTPIEISMMLNQYANDIDYHLGEITIIENNPEITNTLVDFQILSKLGKFHAEKILAAVDLGFFHHNNEQIRLESAIHHMETALKVWEKLGNVSDVYCDEIVMGQQSLEVDGIGKHWRTYTHCVEADLAYLQSLKIHNKMLNRKAITKYPGEDASLTRIQNKKFEIVDITQNEEENIITIKTDSVDIKEINLFYRPFNNLLEWNSVLMKKIDDYHFSGIFQNDPKNLDYDIIYYFQIISDKNNRLWPDWIETFPYLTIVPKLIR